MDKKTFINQYTVQYLATYAAINTDDFCLRGRQRELYENAPLEDARFLAEETWEVINKFGKDEILED